MDEWASPAGIQVKFQHLMGPFVKSMTASTQKRRKGERKSPINRNSKIAHWEAGFVQSVSLAHPSGVVYFIYICRCRCYQLITAPPRRCQPHSPTLGSKRCGLGTRAHATYAPCSLLIQPPTNRSLARHQPVNKDSRRPSLTPIAVLPIALACRRHFFDNSEPPTRDDGNLLSPGLGPAATTGADTRDSGTGR